jgi:hypothetical protein
MKPLKCSEEQLIERNLRRSTDEQTKQYLKHFEEELRKMEEGKL